MAYLAIDGYELPPCKRGVTVVVSTVVDSGRDANGAVVGQRVGRDQYKIDNLEWAWLTADEWGKILCILNRFYVRVTFNDPVTNSRRTVRMYCSNRSAEAYWVTENGTPTHYRNCKVNLIDTGV